MPTLLEPAPMNAEQRLRQRIAELEKRVRDLERAQLVFPQITGTPTAAAANGSGAVDTANKIWVRINGVWRSVAVA